MMMAMTWAIASQLAGQGGLLFKAHNGGPLHAAIIQGELDVIAKEAGIPRLRFHDLRHTQAHGSRSCRGCSAGHPASLGHSKIGITMDLYAHEMPGQDAPAVAALDRMLGDDISRR